MTQERQELVGDRIIVPLDVPTLEAAVALVEQLPQVQFWKVGLELFVSTGPAILNELRGRGKKIFLDLKFHDIPNTMVGACRAVAPYGVDLLTVHAAAGQVALAQAQQAIRTAPQDISPPRLLAVTLLTSISSRSLTSELKVHLEPPDYALQLAQLAQSQGLAGVICSPQEVASIRQVCGEDFLLVCPGVRPTWAAMGDQQRTLTPAMALAEGADYLVIGRPITASPDPTAAFARLCEELTHVA